MALELKSTVIESAKAESFRIYDATTNWGGTNPAKTDVTAASLIIEKDNDGNPVTIELFNSGKWAELIGENGLEVLISDFDIDLSGFPDAYYSILLVVTALAVEYEYDNTQGFLAYMREACRKLPLALDYEVFDYEENRIYYQMNLLMEGAEADANVGLIDRFNRKTDYISEQLNLRGIVYAY